MFAASNGSMEDRPVEARDSPFARARPRVHNAFQNQDQDQAQVEHYFTMDLFKTYYNYLTIDCWYLIKSILQTRQEKVNFKVTTVMKI